MKPLVRIVAPHFVAGLEIGGRCAPIVRYMRTWTVERIVTYCSKKGWKAKVLRK